MRADHRLLEPIAAPKVCGDCRSWEALVDRSGWGRCGFPHPGVKQHQCHCEHYACAEFQDAHYAR